MRVVVRAFVVRHPDALLLVDTGFADDLPSEDVAELDIRRTPLETALASAGVAIEDVDLVTNCHLHADHAGGNWRFGVPIHVQAAEVDAAREDGFTVPGAVALGRANYVVHDGEVEILPGVRLLPTPGHTPGHQCVLVETDQGLVVLAGQVYRWASDFALAAYSHDLRLRGERAPSPPGWLPDLLERGPAKVVFAHDFAVWEPGPGRSSK
jgi:glyoxylase-like metal-dependent hydrolase (beta-lactamase superfamily II)